MCGDVCRVCLGESWGFDVLGEVGMMKWDEMTEGQRLDWGRKSRVAYWCRMYPNVTADVEWASWMPGPAEVEFDSWAVARFCRDCKTELGFDHPLCGQCVEEVAYADYVGVMKG